jgi:hypothetical protein
VEPPPSAVHAPARAPEPHLFWFQAPVWESYWNKALLGSESGKLYQVLIGMKPMKHKSLLQNAAAGFSLRLHRLKIWATGFPKGGMRFAFPPYTRYYIIF